MRDDNDKPISDQASPEPVSQSPDAVKKEDDIMATAVAKKSAAPKARKAKARGNARKAVKAKTGKTATAKAKPASKASVVNKDGTRRTRVHVTIEQLKNWTSVEALAKAFDKEFGDGKVSTARLAISKVPAHDLAKGLKIDKRGERGEMEYRFIKK